MIVVDAGVLAVALADDGGDGDIARDRLRQERLVAPELVYLEVASVIRRHTAAGRITPQRAALLLEDLTALPLQAASHAPLLPRIWELRENVTPYDAAYAALAEALDVTLVTADARFAAAPGTRCRFEVLSTPA